VKAIDDGQDFVEKKAIASFRKGEVHGKND